jgi:hypothetical protein
MIAGPSKGPDRNQLRQSQNPKRQHLSILPELSNFGSPPPEVGVYLREII